VPAEAEPTAANGFRIGRPLVAGAGVLVILAAVAGIVVGSTMGKSPRMVAAAESTTPVAAVTVPKTEPLKSPPTSITEKTQPEKTKDKPTVEIAPPKPAIWKVSNIVVRKPKQAKADFNRIIDADESHELVEVFCDITSDDPKKDQGFDFFSVMLVARESAQADTVRRTAMGFAMLDDGPNETWYTIPTSISVAKDGDPIIVSNTKSNVALNIWPRVPGDPVGPIRIAPKQTPTKLGFLFTIAKGATVSEFRLSDAIAPLNAAKETAPDAVAPQTAAKETVSGKSDPNLNGTWKLVTLYDKYTPGEKSFLAVSSYYQMTINGHEMSVETESGGKKKTSKSTITVDQAKKPHVYRQPLADGKVHAGIYEVVGDTLRMCDQADGKPPESFSADPKDGKRRQILEFVRVKP
jgi:uncharacterized protein (TIGR03067 family)